MKSDSEAISAAAFQDLSDWEIITSLLPCGWQDKAREMGAVQRLRGWNTPEDLLRTLLIHVVEGCSLRETAVRAKLAGLADVSDVAILKKLRASGEWLRWLGEQVMKRHAGQRPAVVLLKDRRVRLVDATIVREPGPTGSNWRFHYSFNLDTLSCDYARISSVRQGESLKNIPVKKGDFLIADSCYSTRPGVRHVVSQGGDVLVRLNLKNLPLETQKGKPLQILTQLRKLKVGEVGEWPCWINDGAGERIECRLCAVKKSRTASEVSKKKLREKGITGQRILRPATIESAGYIYVLTTLGEAEASAAQVLEIYRGRWQIELAFKRLKSLLGFGHLPKEDPVSAQAWLHAKLLVAFLIEALVASGDSFFPWGYPLDCAAGNTESAPVRMA